MRERELHRQDDSVELMKTADILKALRAVVDAKIKGPTQKIPVFYSSESGDITMKHSLTSSGATKLELAGASEEKTKAVLKIMTDMLKIKPKEVEKNKK